jgi:hypothetical protein
MFSDFLTDEGIDESKAGKKIIEAVNKEIRRFFDKSLEAEKYHRNKHIEQEREGSKELGTRTTGDYSSLSYNKV